MASLKKHDIYGKKSASEKAKNLARMKHSLDPEVGIKNDAVHLEIHIDRALVEITDLLMGQRLRLDSVMKGMMSIDKEYWRSVLASRLNDLVNKVIR